MQLPFPGNARQGPPCPHCGHETLLVTDRPDRFECLECGRVIAVPIDDVDYDRGEEDPPNTWRHET